MQFSAILLAPEMMKKFSNHLLLLGALLILVTSAILAKEVKGSLLQNQVEKGTEFAVIPGVSNDFPAVIYENPESGIDHSQEILAEETEVEEHELESSKKHLVTSVFFTAIVSIFFLFAVPSHILKGVQQSKHFLPFGSLGALFLAFGVFRI